MPRLLTVKVLPCISSGRALPFLARLTMSFASRAIWANGFRSASATTTVIKPCSSATAMPMFTVPCRTITFSPNDALMPGKCVSATAAAFNTMSFTLILPASSTSVFNFARSAIASAISISLVT